ncbi:hypothetical protein DDE18_01405 [Nocardioides gansuensis]|uniref:Glycosyl transferase family 1 domain-containing protein n=2 Tax=Nocardioides gansuensis TaxID=2138300 RepID=A0A2T8FF25_9ACTN|nr:hypothetical protein DDE18_01405 [Nocardioides gansuensis]
MSLEDHPAVLVPMGSWTSASPKSAGFAARRVVFLGHMVERMGLPTMLGALRLLRDRGVDFRADILGGGPLLPAIRERVASSDLGKVVRVHGYVEDFADVTRLLAGGSIALAPYEEDENSLSRFADPGKLKNYLSAGLPILLTDVPPNARELAEQGGAEVLASTPEAFAAGIERLLTDEREWERRHKLALDYGREFDWGSMFSRALPSLGIDV